MNRGCAIDPACPREPIFAVSEAGEAQTYVQCCEDHVVKVLRVMHTSIRGSTALVKELERR